MKFFDSHTGSASYSFPGVTLGNNVRIFHPQLVNMYGCAVGDDSRIGTFVEIQKGAVIGARCKVSSHSFICEGVHIEDEVFIGHGVMFTNDKFAQGGPAGGNKSLWRATRLGNRVSIGSNATLLPVEICDDVVIGAGAVVTRDIAISGTYAGNPARLLKSNIVSPSLIGAS
jgi:acetyltransferase-like isoleucine patch superfamily enzyme